MPARGKRKPHAPAGKIIHNGPFLRDANRIMQRQNDAAGPDLNAVGDGRDGGAGEGGIRIESAKGMKMAFRSPDGGKAVLIGKTSAFEQNRYLSCGF